MDTEALPREEWGTFFDDLSREYEEGLVDVTVRTDTLSDAPLISGLPLLGIQLNAKGGDAGSVTVIAGQSEDDAVSHTVMGVTQVHVMRTTDGDVDTVQIDAPDPAQTHIHFLSSI
jgi:hypothetical protein